MGESKRERSDTIYEREAMIPEAMRRFKATADRLCGMK